jgi:hypothetical protein
MSKTPETSRDDVLYAFSVEENQGRETLEKYLKRFPDFTQELVDLSRELSLPDSKDTRPLSSKDKARIQSSWSMLVALQKKQPAKDLFAALDVKKFRAIVDSLGIPNQVLIAFRERKVRPETIPMPFMRRMALAIGSPLEELQASLAMPQQQRLAASFKSEEKPAPAPPATFEEILIQAGVPAERRAELLKAA